MSLIDMNITPREVTPLFFSVSYHECMVLKFMWYISGKYATFMGIFILLKEYKSTTLLLFR
jgi:hypothetical protein